MGSTGEDVLIAKAQSGDDVAYEQLLAQLMEPAHKLACGMLHDTHLAEDAVQEAAVRAWRRLKNLRDGSPIRPWFLGIVANQCRETHRGHWSRLMLSRDLAPIVVEDANEAAIQRLEVRRLLERLGKRERLIVVLHYYLELPWPEIAAISGLSEAGARSRLYRALTKLRPTNQATVTT
ncbi:MAG TPA: sigma-70 family RNA polymerase sigma factor [Candidatus Dormibacteraeota bacterium]|jgi:RNA polymerase sigma-70 factor (ECF subfamily)